MRMLILDRLTGEQLVRDAIGAREAVANDPGRYHMVGPDPTNTVLTRRPPEAPWAFSGPSHPGWVPVPKPPPRRRTRRRG